MGPATAASLALAWKRDRFGLGGRTFAFIVGVSLVAILAGAGFLVANVLPRFDLNQTPELRFDTWPQVLAAASDYLPFGSGVGTFQPVYQSVEPLSMLQSAFWNHAHNDYLELWLETGWLSMRWRHAAAGMRSRFLAPIGRPLTRRAKRRCSTDVPPGVEAKRARRRLLLYNRGSSGVVIAGRAVRWIAS